MAGWTSVQIVTVVVAALTPLTVAALGYFVARAGQRIGQLQWANQTVAARRLDIFKEVAPQINRLLCFATFVGAWKEITPRDAITVKRKLDETMYANRVLFSDEFFRAYEHFMTTMFAMYATTDADAHVRAPIDSVGATGATCPGGSPGWRTCSARRARSARTRSGPPTIGSRSVSAPNCT